MNQSAHKFRPHWGTFASTAQLPNVAGATKQNVNLAVGDIAYVATSLYVCTNATQGAAVWAAVGGGGGSAGPRNIDVVDDLSDANYYESTAGWRGSNNFLACCVINAWGLPDNRIQNIMGNLIAANIAGWAFATGADTPLPGPLSVFFNAVDGGGNIRQVGGVLLGPEGTGGGAPYNRLIVVHGALWQNGGASDLRLWINGSLAGVLAGIAALYSTSSDEFRVGRSPGSVTGESAGFVDVQGAALGQTSTYNTDFDDQDIRDHYEDIMAAGGIVDFAADPFTELVTADGFAGTTPATWDNAGSSGSNGDLTKVGSPTTRTKPEVW